MGPTRCGALRLLLAALATAALACAGSHNAMRAGVDPASIQTIVLLPLNVVSAMPSELEEGAPLVENAIGEHIEASGKTFVRLGLADSHREWLASAAALREEAGEQSMSFEGAARHLAIRLGARQAYDALVITSLTFRPARIRTRHVSWDGVSRRLETVGKEPKHTGSIVLASSFSGEILAPSLAVFVFSPSGALLFEGMGGLDLAHRAHLEPSERVSELRWFLEVRPDLFSDASLVREGVAIAFDPFLPRPDAAE